MAHQHRGSVVSDNSDAQVEQNFDASTVTNLCAFAKTFRRAGRKVRWVFLIIGGDDSTNKRVRSDARGYLRNAVKASPVNKDSRKEFVEALGGTYVDDDDWVR